MRLTGFAPGGVWAKRRRAGSSEVSGSYYQGAVANGRIAHIRVEGYCMGQPNPTKRYELFLLWLQQHIDYFKVEASQPPLASYMRADIVWVDFGFNVGSEFGGMHPAVVLLDSPTQDPMLFVAPLTSQAPDRSYSFCVDLGTIVGLGGNRNAKPSFANVRAIRSVSKLRVKGPSTVRLAGPLLDQISDRIKAEIALR